MSTSHFGGFCKRRDKMMMSRAQAMEAAKALGNARTYLCNICGAFHVTTGSGRPMRSKARAGFSVDNVFEVRTKDYNPNELVPAIPPPDYTGNLRDWWGAVSLIVRNIRDRVPMIRRADHARIVFETEP